MYTNTYKFMRNFYIVINVLIKKLVTSDKNIFIYMINYHISFN